MGKVIKKKMNGISWWVKASQVLLLTLATTTFMYQGLSGPGQALAAGTATITTCGGCHGNPPADGTARNAPAGRFVGSHDHHGSGYNLTCTSCHINNSVNSHSNRQIDLASPLRGVAGESYGQASHPITNAPVFSSCVTYCHSQATSKTSNSGETRTATLSNPLTTLVWGAGSSTCGSCHGAPPSYANQATTWGAAKANSHAAHSTDSITCDYCHFGTSSTGTTITNTVNHAKGTYSVIPNTGKTNAFTYTYAAAGGSCSSSQCHGSKVIQWGANLGAVQCSKCHSSVAGATFTILDGTTNTGKSNTHVDHLNNTHGLTSSVITCNFCHSPVSSTGILTHVNTAPPAEVTLTGASLGSTAMTGTYTGTFPSSSCANTYCHSKTGTWTQLQSTPTFGATYLTSTYPADCQICHAFPPNTGTHLGKGYGAADCYTCHPHVSTTGYAFSNPALHIDGKVDANASCYGCHTGVAGTARRAIVGQFTSATASHHYQGATITDSTAGVVCYACHWEANSDGSKNDTYHGKTYSSTVSLVVWGSSTTRPTTYDTTTAVEYLSGGSTSSTRAEFAKINTHCLGCHNAANGATKPFSAAGDTRNPETYSWDGLSIDERYTQTGTTTWGKFAAASNGKLAQRKAFSAHGNATANSRGWSSVVDSYPSAVATSNVLCFDCHNSHGSTTTQASNTTSYDSATGVKKGGILKDVKVGLGGYDENYKPTGGGSTAEKNIFNAGAGLCFDCHNTATSAGTTPWGYTSTFGFTPPAGQAAGRGIIGYFDTPNFGTAGANFIQTMTFAYKAGKSVNQGGHFGASSALLTTTTKQIGGLCTPCHDPHGVSPSIGAAGSNRQYAVPLLKGTWVTSPYRQDAAPSSTNTARGVGSGSPQALGSVPVYRLDHNTMQANGTNTGAVWTWSANASTLQTTNDTQFAGLCTGCHSKAAINSAAPASSSNWKTMGRVHNTVKGWASTSGGNANNISHAFTCSKCHAPHNSRLPRLMVTNCLDVNHRGRVTSGGNMTTALTGSGSSANGQGRFPSGGAGLATIYYVFGTAGTAGSTRACHDSATAGGAAFSTAAEKWNTRTPW